MSRQHLFTTLAVVVGSVVQDARKREGCTQAELAEMLHVSQSTMSAMETGRFGVSVVRLDAIARWLDTSLPELARRVTVVRKLLIGRGIVVCTHRRPPAYIEVSRTIVLMTAAEVDQK